MLTRMMRFPVGALAATALAASLTGCATDTVTVLTSPPPTMAPEQSVSDACGVSRDEVDAIVNEARQQIEAAAGTLASGELPDLSGLSVSASESFERIVADVSNPEVVTALDDVRAAIDGFGEVAAPESLLAVPGYLTGLGTQLSELQTAGAQLQQLCSAG